MPIDTTENDEAIAQILAEDYNCESEFFSLKRSASSFESCSSDSSKKLKTIDVEQKLDISSSNKENSNSIQINEDADLAMILQIEETVFLDNKINENTIKVTDDQLEKTHTDMAKALQPTQQTDFMVRILGIFTTIQTRYNNCQTKNQTLIDQMQKLSVQLYPTIIAFKTKGPLGISKAVAPTLALGLITNVLQGKIEFSDAKQILTNMLQIWNESSVWYEFFEQLAYILIALTVPSFAQGAMRKIMGRISTTA